MLTIKNLNLSYPNNKKILKNINLDIKKGEFILLTGESGSGKSSLLNAINGLATSYSDCIIDGEIKIFDKDIKNLKLYEISQLISTVFQNPKTYFFNVDTTRELLFFLENNGLNREEMQKRLNEMLKIFKIEHLLDRNIFNLSGGERQILCVASSYISGCEIIILDEPSSNLDEKFTKILKNMLIILKNQKKTILIAEHRIYYLMDLIDKVLIMKNGEIKNEYIKNDFLTLDNKFLNSIGIRSKNNEELKVKDSENIGDYQLKNLKFNFFDKSKLIINNLNFQYGKIYGIVGKNGSGKSTFCNIMLGINKYSKEEVYLNDKKLTKRKRIKLSGLVMQDVNRQLFMSSIKDEISLNNKVSDENINNILKALNLFDLKNEHPMSVSTGQKQRVALASFLLSDKKFIFFDEPTSGMDFKNMYNISRIIKQSITKDKIFFIVSHDLEFLNLCSDYIIDMEKYKKECE